MDSLKQIRSILDKKEFDKLLEIKDELQDAWGKNQIFRTETQARFAVLNDAKFPTKASKYWQSVREQVAHFNELTSLSFEIRRKEIDLKEVQERLKVEKGYIKERLEVDRDELLYCLATAERVAKDRVREIMQWSMLKKELNDGSFDDKNVDTHQRESLFKAVLNRAQVAPDNIPSEERLSIKGIINALKDEPVNKEFVEKLVNKKGDNENIS